MVFLHVGLTDAVKRVGLGVGRPLLLGNVRARIKTLLDERAPIYAEVATVTVETDGRSPDEVADEVADVGRAARPSGRAVMTGSSVLHVAWRGAVRRGGRDRAARRAAAACSARRCDGSR